jgi:type IV pilus assembly protein PilC
VEEILERVNHGEKLSDVMAAYPKHFDSFHVKLITVGESTDSLSEILYAVARESRFEQFLVSKAREIMTYPLFVLNMAALLFLSISVFFMPVFEDVYSQMAAQGVAVPAITSLCLKISHGVRQFWPAFVILLGLCLMAIIWLYSGTVSAHRAMVNLLDRIPGTAGITRVLDSARICSMCRLFLEHHLPIAEALRATALVVQRPETQSALIRVADQSEQGENLAELLSCETDIDSLISYTLKFKPEENLVESLEDLQRDYEQNVMVLTRDAAAAWSIIGIMMMTAAALLMVVMVFVPVVGTHQALQCI